MADFSLQPSDDAIVSQVRSNMRELIVKTANETLAPTLPSLIKMIETKIKSGPMRQCAIAGLWLLADDLDAAHRICQDVETPHGAAWHAVVHRREGDFWNSKYWWRRAGALTFNGLAGRIRLACGNGPAALLPCVQGDRYDPAAFVDLVEREKDNQQIRETLVTVQRLEWLALFEECGA